MEDNEKDEPESSWKEPEKRVDSSWKQQVEREKTVEQAKERRPRADAGPEPTGGPEPAGELPPAELAPFVASIGAQAMMGLGLIPDPVSGEKHLNLEQARYLIDVLGMLQEKTEGNLTEEEAQMLKNTVYDLKMTFVRVMNTQTQQDQQG
jgi:hypothetical protein